MRDIFHPLNMLRKYNFIKDAHNQYKIPKWHRQPHYVEVWIEKQALADAAQSFLKDKEMVIVVNKGYAG
jgi:hypothetical protein